MQNHISHKRALYLHKRALYLHKRALYLYKKGVTGLFCDIYHICGYVTVHKHPLCKTSHITQPPTLKHLFERKLTNICHTYAWVTLHKHPHRSIRLYESWLMLRIWKCVTACRKKDRGRGKFICMYMYSYMYIYVYVYRYTYRNVYTHICTYINTSYLCYKAPWEREGTRKEPCTSTKEP